MPKYNPSKPIDKGHSLWSDAWLRLRKNKMAMVSMVILFIIGIFCFIVPVFPFIADPNSQDLGNTFLPPNGDHLLGTDQSGRDLLARLLYGGQISLLVGIVATTVSVIIGLIYGAVSGYAGGKTDSMMMRIVDILYGLPFLVLVILFSLLISEHAVALTDTLVARWPQQEVIIKKFINLVPLFIAIGALGWLTMARVARAQVLSLKKQEFVEAAVSLGLPHRKILLRHIMPNMLGPVIVYATLTIPGFVLTEATLSFLGLGVESPNSSWGILLSEGANYMETHPRLLIIPSITFSLTLLALNFLGDGLRDALDPKAAKD
ncbi:MAG: ABC transporter permease [Akkermansiaceae bacterium]